VLGISSIALEEPSMQDEQSKRAQEPHAAVPKNFWRFPREKMAELMEWAGDAAISIKFDNYLSVQSVDIT
jgi:hypothetical protein